MIFKRFKLKAIIHSPWIMLGVAAFAAALMTWWISIFLTGREDAMRRSMISALNSEPRVAVLVATSDLPAGATITTQDFAKREVPVDYVYEDTLRAEEFDAVEDQSLGRAVRRGAPIRRGDISAMQARDFSDMLDIGMRALTIDIDPSNSADNMLKPGNRIDLFLIGDGPATGQAATTASGGSQVARLLLSDLLVLATGRDVRARDYGEEQSRKQQKALSDEYSNLTLQVTPEQAGRIALAQKLGTLRAVLRNRADAGLTPDVVVRQAALFGDFGSDGVQFIVGGSRESGVSIRSVPPDQESPLSRVENAPVAQKVTPSEAQQRLVAQVQAALSRQFGHGDSREDSGHRSAPGGN